MNYEEVLKELEQYKEEMTAQERMLEYMKGNEVDHIPVTVGLGETTGNWYGVSVKQYNTTFEARVAELEFIKNHPELGAKYGGSVGMGLRGVGEAVGSIVKYPENSVDYVDEYVLVDWDLFPELKTRFTKENELLKRKLGIARQYKAMYGNDFPVNTHIVGPISAAVAIRKPELFLRDMVKNKEKAHELLDLSVKLSLKWVEMFIEEVGMSAVSLADPVASMSIISAKQFREFCVPHLQDLLNGLKNITGKIPGLHICGKTKPIWNDLVDLGFQVFSVDNCEDLEELKSAVGDRMMISGNVPPVDIMRNGTIDEVIESVRECIKKGGDNPRGYVLAMGCQIPVGTPIENIYAYVYAARKYGAGAKLGSIPKGCL